MIGLLIPTSVCSVKIRPSPLHPEPTATNSLWGHDPPRPLALRMDVQTDVDTQEEPSPETSGWMGIGLTVKPGDILTGALRLGSGEAPA